MTRTLLLIDDDADVRSALGRAFQRDGWEVLSAADGEPALQLARGSEVDLILQDLELPGLGGLELLHALRREHPETAVIVLTGHGDISLAVEAMYAGAENFLPKPPELAALLALAAKAHETTRLRREHKRLARGASGREGIELLERVPALQALAYEVRSLARSDAPVLLQGETGSGKGWLAHLIHGESKRRDKPFVEVNCAGLTATFLESELFGHERGSFTDARERKRGLFEVADGGTLFLDEIGEMELALQPKLLSALESQRFRRLGGTQEVRVDVRVVAATNRPLDEEMTAGRFREDLYYRLSVFSLELPPLRERGRSEITRLTYDLLRRLCTEMGRKEVGLSEKAVEVLVNHSWPGNVRELRNALERALILAPGATELRTENLAVGSDRSTSPGSPFQTGAHVAGLTLAEVEKRHILGELERHEGNRSATARTLGIGRRTLYDRLHRYGVG